MKQAQQNSEQNSFLSHNPFQWIMSAFSTVMPTMQGSGLHSVQQALSFGPVAQAMMGKLDMQSFLEITEQYTQESSKLWADMLKNSTNPESKPQLDIKDKRFTHESWTANAISAYTVALYLLNARYLMSLAESVKADQKIKQQINFVVQQWIDASAPSNFLALNPEAQRTAMQSNGESLLKGMQNMMTDLQKGYIKQTDDTQFEVGKNLAATEGAVVYENDLIQLIQYKPIGKKHYQTPLLLVPPCINKFYILDLQAHNSMVRYLLDQQQQVFLISWRNPTQKSTTITWEDYLEKGVIEAIHAVLAISAEKQLNAMGFCVGGTILSTAVALMAARKQDHSIKSLTLFTSLLDFSDTGILDVFIDEEHLKQRERTIGKAGLISGREIASVFSFLRPNDLVWNYVVSNYLHGKLPPPFDLLYWNCDSTNLPGPMYAWYLRHTYLQNDLCKPNALTLAGERIDLRKIKAPAFIYASIEDHIVPWESAYQSVKLLPGKKTFVLGASGHIAGVINPPASGKRHYWKSTTATLPLEADAWLSSAKQLPGSWWPEWAAWLAERSGALKPVHLTLGSKKFPVIEPAPGRYVKQRLM